MYGCESWTIKKAEHRRTVAFELWCWRRLLRVRWKSTLNIHWKDWCWSWSSSPLATEVKTWLTRKDPDAGRDWGQEEKGLTEDEMAGWHHWLNGCESEWTLGVGDRQGGLACCDSWGCKESDTTERLNWTELNQFIFPWAAYENFHWSISLPTLGIASLLYCGHLLLSFYIVILCPSVFLKSIKIVFS